LRQNLRPEDSSVVLPAIFLPVEARQRRINLAVTHPEIDYLPRRRPAKGRFEISETL
jgi:hypothetical protein